MARIELRDVRKSFDATPILRGVSLVAEDGEFLVLVGPSGCGKSTLLRSIAGLEALSGGEVWIGGTRVDPLPPRDRDLAMVFQSYALYPHMTVAENLAFGLAVRKTAKAEVASRVAEVASMLGLEPLLARYPRQLSGGQRQRVAMGRALVRRPQAFLFDEPLSNLDATLRGEVRVELKRLHAQLGATMVYVTHDQVEAMTLATRIAVLRAGVLMQHGTPAELYARPQNEFVATFIGSPPMNVFDARAAGGAIEGAGGALRIDAAALSAAGGPAVADGRALRVGVRPQDLALGTGDGPAAGHARVSATVDVLEPLGPEVHVHARAGGCAALTAVLLPAEARGLRPGAALALDAALADVHVFDAETQQRVG